jgi:hypothetical protein
MMSDEKEIVLKILQDLITSEMPAHIEVSKNSKGYNYSVSLHGKDMVECLDAVMKTMDILKEKFQ